MVRWHRTRSPTPRTASWHAVRWCSAHSQPFSDEARGLPGSTAAQRRTQYAIAFSAPCLPWPQTPLPGRVLDRRLAHFDAPFSGRFDEQDAFLIFDDVEIPRSRVFIDGNTEVWNAAMMNGWTANIMQQTTIRAEAKLRFAYELVSRFCKSINASDPRTRSCSANCGRTPK